MMAVDTVFGVYSYVPVFIQGGFPVLRLSPAILG
jgi:hypothetical protein